MCPVHDRHGRSQRVHGGDQRRPDGCELLGHELHGVGDTILVQEIEIATGSILHSFSKTINGPGDFAWDGPFTVVRQAFVIAGAFTAPAPLPKMPQLPCAPQVQLQGAATGQGGCNVGGVRT
jgi:hypothetical protein